jgi:hypothetical protein
MAHFKATAEGQIPFTEEEEAQWEVDMAEMAASLAEQIKKQYQYDRAKEYPPMSDYIDGVVKGDQAQVQAYIDACLAVKAKYPKPTQE